MFLLNGFEPIIVFLKVYLLKLHLKHTLINVLVVSSKMLL